MGADRRLPPPRWGEARPRTLARLALRLRAALAGEAEKGRETLPALPVALQHGELAASYLAAKGERDHRRAGAAAIESMERAIAARDWWPADAWAHRALWHFEQANLGLQAARAARRIGDLRSAAGDPESARRYYAEAISEARDMGAEREEGLAAYGLGRAHLELGDVTTARRLAQVAVDLLERCGAPQAEVDTALELRGTEKRVSEGAER